MRPASAPLDPPPAGRSRLVALVFAILGAALLLALWPLDEPWRSRAAGRLARGVALKPSDFVQLWLWWGILGNALLCAALAATARFWVPWSARRPTPPLPHPPARSRAYVLALAGIVILAGALRAPLLGDAMRRDESDTAVRNVHGVTLAGEDGSRVFRPAGWPEALWENAGANNPVLFSILAHAGLDLWRGATGAPREQFHAAVLRWPSWVAGVLACVALAELGRRLGFRRAGLTAAALLAIHPWHLRYSAEGRGYALNLLLVLVSCICLIEALRHGSWKWWSGWGGSIFAALYAYPGAIYVPAVATALTALWIWRESGRREVRLAQTLKLAISTLLAGGLFVLLMLPCAPQILAYLKRGTALGPMNAAWWAEWIGCLTTGIQLGFYDGRPPTGFGRVYDFRDALQHPEVLGLSIAVIPLLWATGALRCARSGRTAALVVAIAVLSPLAAWAHNRITGNYLYPWYLIYFLPFTLLFVGAALDSFAGRLADRRARGIAAALIPALYVAAFLHASSEPLRRLDRGPGNPFVTFTRGRYEDRVYPQGWITRHTRPEWRQRYPLPSDPPAGGRP
jgi:hypothetical protein